jgi:large subunit ribosomal protein L9
MEVILLERVAKLGAIGDTVKVKDGFARNFLIPQKKALRATEANKKVFEGKRAEIEAQNKTAKAEAEKQAKKMEGLSVTLVRQSSDDGRLYGSVSARDIADQIVANGHEIDRKTVILDTTIKNAGTYKVKLALHPEVVMEIPVIVARNEGNAEAANAELASQQEADARANAAANDASDSDAA